MERILLDLDYLISLFKDDVSKLDVGAVMSSKVNLNYVLIDYQTGKLVCKKPNKENIFELVKACCSLPIVHGPSKVEDKLFFDSVFVKGGLPLLKEIAKKHDEVVVLLNMPREYKPKKRWWLIINIFFPMASYFYPKLLRKVFRKRKKQTKRDLKYAMANKKVKVIYPSKNILSYGGDSDARRISETIEFWKWDAREFLSSKNI